MLHIAAQAFDASDGTAVAERRHMHQPSSLLALLAISWSATACAPSQSHGADGGVEDAGAEVDAVDAATRTRPESPPPPPPCVTAAGMDFDGDGFPLETDCNDCSAQINPGAFDAAGNGVDEDCSGADAVTDACDADLPLSPDGAADAARAIGLCRTASGDADWGVISARFTTADGRADPWSPDQVGLLPSFGPANTPREGSRMLALSSGAARAPGQPGYTSACDVLEPDHGGSSYPPTFPQESGSCPGVSSGDVYDSVALEVTVRVPTNARGFSFHSSFFTFEYPGYICQEFNDFFAVLQRDDAGAWRNIVFDADTNPVSVNNALLRVCEAGTAGGKRFACPLGRAALAGTGFGLDSECGYEGAVADPDDPRAGDAGPEVGAGTGWLRTISPVTPGELLTLRFTIWDSGDGTLDSTALVDGFAWELDPVEETETVPDLI